MGENFQPHSSDFTGSARFLLQDFKECYSFKSGVPRISFRKCGRQGGRLQCYPEDSGEDNIAIKLDNQEALHISSCKALIVCQVLKEFLPVKECCRGYEETEEGRCKAHCSKPCIHGDCVQPNTCKCQTGWLVSLL